MKATTSVCVICAVDSETECIRMCVFSQKLQMHIPSQMYPCCFKMAAYPKKKKLQLNIIAWYAPVLSLIDLYPQYKHMEVLKMLGSECKSPTEVPASFISLVLPVWLGHVPSDRQEGTASQASQPYTFFLPRFHCCFPDFSDNLSAGCIHKH